MQKQNYFFLFLFFALISGGLQAQVVTIPDADFLAALIQQGVDTNGDGQIQQTEAAARTSLYVSSSSISSLVGIQSFTNLQILNCSNNQLPTLNVSPLVNLQYLNCESNYLTTLDVSALVNLQYLRCSSNPLTTLDVSALVNLQTLFCVNNQLTTLDVSALVNLQTLYCVNNQLTTLDVSALVNLQTLCCYTNQLTTLDVSALGNLLQLSCSDNPLTTLDVSVLVNLNRLDCTENQLTTLDVSDLVNLQWLDCSDNQLTTLDVSALVNLQQLYCSDNQLTTLDVSTLDNLYALNCNNNQLTTLDVGTLGILTTLLCNNNQLINLNMKNGHNENWVEFSNNPNLQYICIDATDVTYVQSLIVQYGLQNVAINTFCTYSLGENYNTLSGTTTYDADMNGCSLADSTYHHLRIAVTNGIDSGYVYTNLAGQYTTFLDTGTYTFTPQPENPTYFSASPLTTSINFPNNNNNTQIQDFCITPNGIFPDVEITISPITVARPGFDATYKILFHNKGTTVVNGNVTLDFMGNKMSLVSSSVAPSSQMTNQLTWAYSNLQPFESRSITLEMNILPPPTNNIGDILNFNANISLSNDANTYDNTFTFNQDVIGAYDPNDKTCLEGNHLLNSKIGEYLHYLVRFQNTGNYPAENVVVVDSLNASKYDMASLQVLETSHETHIDVKNNVLQFYFENIQLADSFSNEPASHGYVLFKIKTKATLPQNSSVSNKVEIYFDFNPPVITNTETTTFSNGVGIDNTLASTHFQCFPNPAHNQLTITTSRPLEIEIVNVLGETLIRKLVQDKEDMDISTLASGTYWIKEKNTGMGQVFMKE